MSVDYLSDLENESIFLIREAVAKAKNPVMMYSMGKDSSVLLHLAKKAFYPHSMPFSFLHIDTLFKFQDMYDFRDMIIKKFNINLIKYTNPEVSAKNINPFDFTSEIYTDVAKTQALKQAIDQHEFDFIIGGARRDEEKSRSKERIFSFRDAKHIWNPKYQRPELWNLFNTEKNNHESFRVFPLSNWTELDIWRYIEQERVDVVPLYFSKQRPVVVRDQKFIMVDDGRLKLKPDEKIEYMNIRFRTLGCYPLTAAISSTAITVSEIINELAHSHYSERQGRLIDSDIQNSMEKKKIEGYF